MHLRSCPDPVTTLRPTANLAIETTSQLLLAKALQGQQPADMMQQHHLQLPTEPSNIGPFDPTSCRSLYIGNLHPYVAETQLQDLFSSMGSVSEVKVIKDKATGMSAGYGFVKFLDHA